MNYCLISDCENNDNVYCVAKKRKEKPTTVT